MTTTIQGEIIVCQSKNNIFVRAGEKLDSVILSVQGTAPKLEPRRDPITETDKITGKNLDSDRKIELLDLLNKYRTCSAMNDSELGSTHLIEMDIQEKPESVPVVSRPYKINATQKTEMNKKIGEWKTMGIVKETNSRYASPCLLTVKPDGTIRLVVDYKRLNKNTIRMVFPLPNIDDGLEFLHGVIIFVIIDLKLGYLQIPLTESAKEKTAFITPTETR